MCGIAGYAGEFSPGIITHMSQAIQARGPDGDGIFRDEENSIALAHRRLAILDLSPSGAQPMTDSGGRAVIVFNGEIYNFRELRADLERSGFTFFGRSDTEVLLNLYLRDGVEMLGRLNGIFAFAIWDRSKRELFVARDGWGVKPFYYLEDARGFAFASELKALRSVFKGRTELDAVALHRYLSFLWSPGDGTPLQSVRRLPPGNAMTIRDGRIAHAWAWYRLPVFRAPTPLESTREVVEGTARHLETAVERQMVADVPVGAFLSGGLDSSAIVTFARKYATDLRCFTIDVQGGHEKGMVDDLPYARRVAAHLGVKLDVVHVESAKMAGDLPSMVYQLDEPQADAAPLNVLYISRLARESGIKVLLSGAGGDDVFSGYRRHVAVMVARLWEHVPSLLRSAAAELSRRFDQRDALSRRIAKALNGATLAGDARIASWFQWIPEPELWQLYTPDFRAQIGSARAVTPLLSFLEDLDSKTHPLERMLALEQRFFLSDHNLLYTDKMSMAAGVETRVPFLDHDLVDFAARIPAWYKQHGRTSKWALKKAMEPHLPKNVIYRSKTGFGVPLRRWLREDLRELVDEVLSHSSLSRRGLFDHAAVSELRRRDDDGRIDATYVIFALVCIELWCRAFIDGRAV